MLMLVDQHYSMDDNYGPRPDPRTRLWQDTGSGTARVIVFPKTKVRVNLSNSDDLCGGREEVAVVGR
jgi:hypothetical protein